jgi:phage terminase large subunit
MMTMAVKQQKIQVQFPELSEIMNEKYLPLLKNKSRYLVLYGGGSSGKSVAAAQKIILRMLMETPHKFLVIRKVKEDIRDSCFAELVGVINDWGVSNLFKIPTGRSSELYLKCYNGNEILFFGLDNVEKRKSIKGITGEWIEEASEIEEGDFNQLDIRMRGPTRHYKQTILTFNPILVTHWLKKRFVDKVNTKITAVHSTYKDNKFLDQDSIDVLEAFQDTDEYYYNVYCLGLWGTTGDTVYPAKIVTQRLVDIKEKPPLARGIFTFDYRGEKIIDSSIKFVQDDNGPLKIYEMPQKGYPYVLGGDTAEGGADWQTGSIRNNVTLNQAAVWRSKMDGDMYAKYMYCLGRFYNDALIGIEVNFDYHPTQELQRLGYYKQYKREIVDDISLSAKQHKFGFMTTRITRPVILSKHVAQAREHIETFNDADTLEEMLSFIRVEKGNKIRSEADSGAHDDLIFADAIALEIRGQQTMSVKGEPKLEFPPGTSPYDQDKIKTNVIFLKDYEKFLANRVRW